MASSEVLQEYLVRVGYQTDASSFFRMNQDITSVTSSLLSLSKGFLGLAAATITATAVWSNNMRKMVFTSEMAGTSIKNLKAIGYAAEQVGLSSDSVAGTLANISKQIRTNPGYANYASTILGGKPLEGMDTLDILMESVKSLNERYSYPQAAMIAEGQLGIPEDEFHQLTIHFDKFNKKVAEYVDQSDKIKLNIDNEKDAILKLAEATDKFSMVAGQMADKLGLTATVTGAETASKAANITEQEAVIGTEAVEAAPKKIIDSLQDMNNKFWKPNKYSKSLDKYSSYFERTTKKYNLPQWLLPSVANVESKGDPNLTSSAGAMGLMQFMPATAQQYNVNPWDPESAIEGAGHYYSDLLKKYDGNISKAVAAYNMGPNALDKYLAGKRGLPSKTEKYLQDVTGTNLGVMEDKKNSGQVTQNNTVTIIVKDAKEAAEVIKEKVSTWADAIRQHTSVFQ